VALPSWAQWGWAAVCDMLVTPVSKYVLAAESTLAQIINNSYMAVYEFPHFFFTFYPNYLTLTCEANGEYTLLLLHFRESSLMAD